MKCALHEEKDAIANCAKCGVGICKSCEEVTNFRIDNRAMCEKCNIQTFAEQIEVSKKFISQNYIKIGIMGAVLVWGIVNLIKDIIALKPSSENGVAYAIFGMLLIWGLASVTKMFSNYQAAKENQSAGSQVREAIAEARNPGATMIGKFIGIAIMYLLFAASLPIQLGIKIFQVIREHRVLEHNTTIYQSMLN